MRVKLSALDVKILRTLGEKTPRNLAEVARSLGIPTRTVHFRINRMSHKVHLRLNASIFHAKLGMKRAVVFADAFPGFEQLLFECLKANDFWGYVNRCYGNWESCFAVYTIPVGYEPKFEEFLHEIQRLDMAEDIRFYWTSSFQYFHVVDKWFDLNKYKWVFPWESWISEIETSPVGLPQTLAIPKDFENRADKIDVLLLKELEKDAAASLNEVAEKLGISPQLVHYHYEKHVLKKGLLAGFQVFFFRYEPELLETVIFVFRFFDEESMAKFAMSLLDKPFTLFVSRILDGSTLIVEFSLPKVEFRDLIDSLSTLARLKLVKEYTYYIQDIRPTVTSRQTLPYEFFKNGKWVYDHKEHLLRLRELKKDCSNKA
jgi:DNA-binding Lrp family transcriptional regulator